MKNVYVADFETTTEENDCRVWSWGLYNVFDDVFIHGNSINTFFEKIYTLPNKTKILFHNIKFDSEFCYYYLYQNGYTHTMERNLMHKEFNTLITNMGVHYAFNICWKGKEYVFNDSLKIIPIPVENIAKDFNLKQRKGEIDYKKYRPVGYQPTPEEIEYLKNDVEIVGKALLYFYTQNLNKMTTAGNAFSDFQGMMGKKFKKYFPNLDHIDKELRQAYKGGFTYCSPKYQGKIVKNGIVLDVNSLYPSVMYYEKLPFGFPIYFEGEYVPDEMYDLYIVMFRCNFTIKKNHIPTIQIKKSTAFIPTEYVTDSNNEDVVLTLTSVDLKLFFEHYDVYNIHWFGGWKFRSTDIFFKPYIDKWMKVKEESTITGNKAKRQISKLMMNSLYGRFALNGKVKNKIPLYDAETGLVYYDTIEGEDRETIYLPVACFITAYARYKTITSAQQNYDVFCYADTDSLHLATPTPPENLEVDNVKLGAWKLELNFTKAKFVRAKSYIEEEEATAEEWEKMKEEEQEKWKKRGEKYYKINVTCAGLPKSAQKNITFEKFKGGLVVSGKLQHHRVKGGVILKEIDFTVHA